MTWCGLFRFTPRRVHPVTRRPLLTEYGEACCVMERCETSGKTNHDNSRASPRRIAQTMPGPSINLFLSLKQKKSRIMAKFRSSTPCSKGKHEVLCIIAAIADISLVRLTSHVFVPRKCRYVIKKDKTWPSYWMALPWTSCDPPSTAPRASPSPCP